MAFNVWAKQTSGEKQTTGNQVGGGFDAKFKKEDKRRRTAEKGGKIISTQAQKTKGKGKKAEENNKECREEKREFRMSAQNEK